MELNNFDSKSSLFLRWSVDVIYFGNIAYSFLKEKNDWVPVRGLRTKLALSRRFEFDLIVYDDIINYLILENLVDAKRDKIGNLLSLKARTFHIEEENDENI